MRVWVTKLPALAGVGLVLFSAAHVNASPPPHPPNGSLFSLTLEELLQVKVATDTSVPVLEAPSSVSVITAEKIKLLGANTLPEALASVPGLSITPSTLNRMQEVYSFRGLYSGLNSQVLFLLNGKRIRGTLYEGGPGKLGSISLKGVKRIEVIRGPGSAVYGADAFSGVINIITLDEKMTTGGEGGLLAGSNNTIGGWFRGSRKVNKNTFSGYVELHKRDSSDDRIVDQDAQTGLDAGFGSDASLAPGRLEDRLESVSYGLHVDNQSWGFSLDGYYLEDKGVGAGAAQAIDPIGSDSYNFIQATLGYKDLELFPSWPLNVELSHQYSEEDVEFYIFPAGSVLPVGDDGNIFRPHSGEGCETFNVPGLGCLTTFSEGLRGNPDTKNNVTLLDFVSVNSSLKNHKVRLAVGARYENLEASEEKNFGSGVLDRNTLGSNSNPLVVDGRLTSVTGTEHIFIDAQQRTVAHISLQDQWQIAQDWQLTSGLRYDNHSDFGGTLNPRVALVWQTTDKFTSRAFFATAYREPTFSELGAKNNPVAVGSPDLDPETIETSELAFSYKVSDEHVHQLNFYRFVTSGMIDFVLAPETGLSTAENAYDLEGKGVEYEVRWIPLKNIKVSFSYSHQDTENSNTGQIQPYLPKSRAVGHLSWNMTGNWLLSGRAEYNLDRPRELGDEREALPDYGVFDLILRNSDLGALGLRGLNMTVAVKNSFDRQYRMPSNGSITNDYPEHGRRFYFSLGYEF